jgi:hypothetical protein
MSKKKRRPRLGSQSSQNVALGWRELIVRTLAQEPHAHLRLRRWRGENVRRASGICRADPGPLGALDEKKATGGYSWISK